MHNAVQFSDHHGLSTCTNSIISYNVLDKICRVSFVQDLLTMCKE